MNTNRFNYSIIRLTLALAILETLLPAPSLALAAASGNQFDIVGPSGSGHFGQSVTVLPNGNFVVTDPDFSNGNGAQVGAVYLFDGATGAQISVLTGSSAGDHVGSGGVTVLSNGNYVVISQNWRNAAGMALAGAVTWGSKTTGVSGTVSAANSLVGVNANDQVGLFGVKPLTNGNYVMISPFWRNPAGFAFAGAVTWGNGATGVSGEVSAANSLVGSSSGDQVGYQGVIALTNGNYVVISYQWDNTGSVDAGAVTWGNGSSGTVGAVSAANSLVGSHPNDQVGFWRVTTLNNGNYVVLSPYWNNNGVTTSTGLGAITWGNGASGVTGVISAANSLVGSTAGDQVGISGVAALGNGNYVVSSPFWDLNATFTDVGAVTWGDGSSGIVGAVSAANSLVGGTTGDKIGAWGVTGLSNNNYVVPSLYWDNGAEVDAGAATWGNGASGVIGTVSSANSLVGSHSNDNVGSSGVIALSNGNYVVSSPNWRNAAGETLAGAATWGNGASGITGAVSASNSLVGVVNGDQAGSAGITALSNGNYLVPSPNWRNATFQTLGAVTWGNGASGVTGEISALNSLVGSTDGDKVGSGGATALSNGNYVVISPLWDNPVYADVGAVTWGNGSGSLVGVVSQLNSLAGTEPFDQVGSGGVTALSNGNYVVRSPLWGNAIITPSDVGAATWGNGSGGIAGQISAANSLLGSTAADQVSSGGLAALDNGSYVVTSPLWDNNATIDAGAISWSFGSGGIFGSIGSQNSVLSTAASGGSGLNFQYDATHRQLVVGRPSDNLVTLFGLPRIFLPVVSK